MSTRVPQFGLLALVTYAVVFLTLAGAVASYKYLAAKREADAQPDLADTRMVQVGGIWIPAYPGAALGAPVVAQRGETTDGSMSFATADPAAQVVSYFASMLAKTGYQTAVDSSNAAGGKVQAIRRGGRMRVDVTVQAVRDGADVTIRTLFREDLK